MSRTHAAQPRLLLQVHEARVPAATGPKRTGPGAWHRDLSRKGYTDREPPLLTTVRGPKQPCPGAWPVPGSGTWPERLGGLDAETVEQRVRVRVDLDRLEQVRDDAGCLQAVAGDEQHDLVVRAELAAGDRRAQRSERHPGRRLAED